MKKEIIKEEVFNKHSDKPITFKEVSIKLEPDDVIYAGLDPGFYSENESWDSHFFFIVTRQRLETDEEFEKRKANIEKYKEESKKRRYETYLNLKKEFE